MSTDRGIRLDMSAPDIGSRPGQDTPGGAKEGYGDAPDPQLQQRFKRALEGQAQPEGPESGEPASPLRGAFDLFGPAGRHALPPPAPHLPDEFFALLDEQLSRLMVGEGSHGGKQVRMDIKEDTLPGVSVVIEEAQGRLQVSFICAVESSRLRLNAHLPQHAPALAQRLQRDVLLRVCTDDPEDPRVFEMLCLGAR